MRQILPERFQAVAITAGLAAVYFVAAKLGLALAFFHTSVTSVWPPTGISIGALVLFGYRAWPGVLAGAFLANYQLAGQPFASLGIAAGNTLEALAGAWFINRLGGRRAFEDPRVIFRFVVLAGPVASAISSVFGVASLFLSGGIDPGTAGKIWFAWWTGDMISAWLFAPLVVLGGSLPKARWKPRRAAEAAALVLSLVLVNAAVFGAWFSPQRGHYPLEYLSIPLLLWAAFRFGRFGAMAAILIQSVIAVKGTAAGHGPFAWDGPGMSLLLLQVFLGTLAVTLLILAAVVRSRKLALQELEKQRGRLDQLLGSVPGVVWEVWGEPDGTGQRIGFVSASVESMLGYSAQEWFSIPDFWLSIVHPEDRQRAASESTALFAGGLGGVIRFRWLAKDGRYLEVESHAAAILGPGGKPAGMRGVTMDISERWKAEDKLRQTEDLLRHSQKMEAMGRLAGGVAHDFNNLLTAVNGYSDLLLGILENGNPLRPHVEEINKAGQRGAALTRQLLAFSRKQVTLPKILHLNFVVRDMEKMLQRVIGEDIALTAYMQEDLYPVKADPDQLAQVIINLAVNSRDAMPHGGSITLETANETLEGGEDGYFLKPPAGEYVRLSVMDSGTGIGDAVKLQLFEPFFTTKEQSKGTGLGLSMIYGILEQKGGGIRVVSEPGRGAAFHLYLPRASRLPALF